MNILAGLLGFYLFVGLLITFEALGDEIYSNDLSSMGFVWKIIMIMGCIISSPIIFVKCMRDKLKK